MMKDFFAVIGTTLGELIRLVVDLLSNAFRYLDDAAGGFFQGLAGALGVSPSIFSFAMLLLGIWLLWRGIRALLQGAIFATLIWCLLGVLLLGWLIN